MKVAIVGAGVAGLQQGRALQKRGIDFHIYEAEDEVGGVWRKTAHLQGAQGTHKWTVRCQSTHTKDSKEEVFDFVVLATGSFLVPNIPNIQGRECFSGKHIIAKELTTENLGIAKGKRVVVIGSAKSALDVAGAAGEIAESVTMLCRQAHYWMPMHVLGIPCNYIKYSRFGVWLTTHPYPSSYPSLPQITSLLHTIMRPVKQAIWKAVGFILPWQSRLPPEMIPTRGAEEDNFAELGTISPGCAFLKHLRSGKINVVPGQAEHFTVEGLKTTSNQLIATDLLIYATGFMRTYNFLSEDLLNKLHATDEGIPLYRDTLPPSVQGLAFVGCEVITFNAVTSSGLQAEWLAALLQGDFVLPEQGELERDVARKQSWRYSFIPPHNFRVGRIAHCHQLLWDELLCDMGHPKFRKGWGLLREIWQPYNSADYRDLFNPAMNAHMCAEE